MHLTFDRKEQLKQIFSTPLGMFMVPNARDLMPRIARVVLDREAKEEGVDRSNRGGWHSDDELLNWPELQFAELADTFRSAVSHMIAATSGTERFNVKLSLGAWANVNRAGSFNNNHIHPGYHWSGVFYVQAPNLKNDPLRKAGQLALLDPRGPIAMVRSPGQGDLFTVQPRAGMIVLFPSWLYHCVNSFTLDAVRISIAFNARIDNFEPITD